MITNIAKFFDVFITFIVSGVFFVFFFKKNKLVKNNDDDSQIQYKKQKNKLLILSLVLIFIAFTRLAFVLNDVIVNKNKLDVIKIDNCKVSIPGIFSKKTPVTYKDSTGADYLILSGYQSNYNQVLYSFIKLEFLKKDINSLKQAHEKYSTALKIQGFKIIEEKNSKLNGIDFKEIFVSREKDNKVNYANSKYCLINNTQYILNVEGFKKDIFKSKKTMTFLNSFVVVQ